MTRSLLIFAFLLLSAAAVAQREKKVEATYTYVVLVNVSMEQARRTALDRAKIQAIADEFGTVVTQSNTAFVRNENGNSSIDFQSLGGSDVKGEWIETIGEPKDDMYLYFKSPVDGYLAVYLLDAAAQTAYCLLSYSQSSDAAQRIEHDCPYIFFSEKHAPKELRGIVDELTMTCNGEQERNDLFVIFSPNAFVKANSERTIEALPRELSFEQFNICLVNQRSMIANYQYTKKLY